MHTHHEHHALELAERIARAWTDPGPHPRIHQEAQDRLTREWPSLAIPVIALALHLKEAPAHE